ncbi:ABC transporter ATP-binding protein [Reinekea blandensis]|uniref:ABC transporter, ATP-binding protein n=1 Tax=Reinekea blandensis MED297 TaxID=314283 RepID=A4BG53_9GAMM|nr:ABC transporter ATP-binding protein [Reinekea blandensis]EAR08848.1 ABC transporter, ATP-binding protein [Reinekea sp. MED297] [Reinekea blandensis MED297]
MITLQDLGFTYRRQTPVFSGLTLTIPAGRSVGILGANGAGKTTLLKLISGMIRSTQGHIDVLGHEPRARQTAMLQNLYIVPEESDLPPMTGHAYVKHFSVFYPTFKMDTLSQMAEQFELDLSVKLTERSLGQKKKFLVAFALATHCPLILMDEPTNGLDIPSKAQFRDMIIRHQGDDQTLLISTHQVRDLDAIIDSVVMMNEEHAHWFDLGDLPNHISQVSPPAEGDQVIYRENRFSGDVALVQGQKETATGIDLELLFNAFHTRYDELISTIEQEVQQ